MDRLIIPGLAAISSDIPGGLSASALTVVDPKTYNGIVMGAVDIRDCTSAEIITVSEWAFQNVFRYDANNMACNFKVRNRSWRFDEKGRFRCTPTDALMDITPVVVGDTAFRFAP